MSEACNPGSEAEGMSFEQKLGTVKSIIDGIEGGRLPLEEAVRQYERGIDLLGGLEKELEEMKRRITVLQEEPGDTPVEVPMSPREAE